MNATEPQKADTFFKNLSPSMASFYNEAKKLSKKYEHFFIGQEHFLAAFFLNNNSVIRKYPRNPKWNAKKKIDTLLKSSYAAQKNGCNWFKQNGFLVNPRMQDSWSEAVGRTKFKDSAEVHEIHVLYGIFERPNKPIVDWLEQEGLYNEAAIKSFLEEEMKNQDKLVYEKGDVEEKPEKPKANPFGFLAKLLGGGKEKPIEAESAFTAEDDEEDEARNASILYTDEYDFKHDKNSMVSHVPDPEPEYIPQSAPSDSDVEPYIPQAPKPSKKKSRSLNIGNQFVYMEDELINRGMPQGIFDRFAELNDKLGSLPDKVPFNGKKIYFDDLLNKNLSESEYEDVVNAMSSSADAAASRSPFRSTVDSSASQHSLFKSKSSDKAEGSETSGVYEINSSDSAPENSDDVPSFSDSSKDEVPSFSDSPKDEVPSFSDSPKDEVPSFSDSSKDDVPSSDDSSKDEVPSFSDSPKDEVPSFSDSPKDEVPSFSDSSKDDVPSFGDSSKDEASEADMSSEEDKPVDADSENQEGSEGPDAEQASRSETDSEDGEEEVAFASYTFEPIAHVKGSTPYSLYAANREAVSISGILKDNGQYFVKTADEIQDGFHWSEMFDFTPVNFVKMPQKSAKNDAELLSAGKIRRKA